MKGTHTEQSSTEAVSGAICISHPANLAPPPRPSVWLADSAEPKHPLVIRESSRHVGRDR